MAMDLYYQDYAPRDAYFDLPAFKLNFAWVYSAMLDAEFQEKRKEGRAETGFTNIENSSAWLLEETLTTAYVDYKDRVTMHTSSPIYSFRWDASGNSIQGIRPCKGVHRFRKINMNEARFEHIYPTTNFIYYYLNNGSEIEFLNGIPNQQLIIRYIPVVDGMQDNCLIADGLVMPVIEKTLEAMFKAKAGNVIQKADDGNQNLVQSQQVNPSLSETTKQYYRGV